MNDLVHVCKPTDTTRTLCGQKAGLLVAVNFSEFLRARGPFCPVCERAARAEKARRKGRA